MLRPIPAKIMRSTATVKCCTGIDRYQNQTYETYTVKKVHLQPTNELKKTAANTSNVMRAVLFVDRRHSTPNLDWMNLFKIAQEIPGDIKVTVRGIEYTVFTVDELMDDTDCFHHYEISLE